MSHFDEKINNVQPTIDTANVSFIPSLESNPYSLQCLIDWVDKIENDNKIMVLDFDKIEQDLQHLLDKYGKKKVKGLFYPNWRPMKYIYDYDSYRHEHYDKKIFEQNKQNIKTIYMKLFGNTESIIHYILNNKSFLFKLPSPDINNLQPKLSKLLENNGELLFKLNMKQSIYILRLLLYKFEIIEPGALFKDKCTIINDIEPKLRSLIVTDTFIYNTHEIEQLYLNLICDIYSISDNQEHKSMINIFVRDENKWDDDTDEIDNQWYHCNFFDTSRLDYRNRCNPANKISIDIMKQLLFRGIPPFQITNRADILDYEIDEYDDLTITQQSKLFFDCLHQTLDKVIVNKDIFRLRAATIPLMICEIADSVQPQMQQILDELLKDKINPDCIPIILQYIYIDWNSLLPKIDDIDGDRKIAMEAGKFINCLLEINLEEMEEKQRIEWFDKRFLTKEISQYFFNDTIGDDWLHNYWMEKLFVCQNDNIYEFGFKIMYQLAKLQRFSDEILHELINVAIKARSMNESYKYIH